MANIIYIMGKSSTGKDTIYNLLKGKIDVNTYILYTTRPKREGEENAKDYYFITEEQFKKLKEQGKVIEYRSYNVVNSEGKPDIWTYATIDDNQWKAKGDFLTIGTLESYNSILLFLKTHPERNLNILPVYILIDEEERKTRAIKREGKEKKPNLKEIARRFAADNIDFSDENLRKAGITKEETFENYNLEECIGKILNYIKIKTSKVENKKNL